MTLQDVELYHTWRNDRGYMKSTSILDIYHIDETKEFVSQAILGSGSSRSYIIVKKESNNPVGITSLINIGL